LTDFDLQRGEGALVVSIPHDGREVPDAIRARMTATAADLPDTDWHVRQLYDFLSGTDTTVIAARWSRYVVDLNRPPDGRPLYAGGWESTLVPTQTFGGDAIYSEARPDPAEVDERRARYWVPYHTALEKELRRVKDRHGFALLWDAHSIRRTVPSLFEGPLPDLSVGTAGGASCAEPMAQAVFAAAEAAAPEYSAVRDARFRGGYIPRHYGRPHAGVHAIQLELVQATYMDEAPPYPFRPQRAERIRPHLRRMLDAFVAASARS
jgi:N-formylglutamate amidohydrolase